MSLEDQDPLAAALSSAFVSSPSLRPDPSPQDSIDTGDTSTSTTESSVSSDALDSTSEPEYEAHVSAWRMQSAEARQKAEMERARWEAIRAAEKQEAALLKAAIPADSGFGTGATSEHDWEAVGSSQEAARPSPSPADARDLVTGEHPRHVAQEAVQTMQKSQDSGNESQKWDEVSSQLTSSFPSLSFPDRTSTPSPHLPPPPRPLESASLVIFDSSLSTRTRLTALFSSLAINLLLPFVNGVMLGFGEIFAKNIVLEYFGWRPLSRPGATAASAGLRATRRTTNSSSTAK
ncbi:hypothetical protein GGX14DRAFT_418241 [Mycena pura]|uniref:Uncharacterized protein n=1 Tax=Mycena pura TaxID=153505 RepID=A0AAD6YRH2_9AGAR|nr:hypothetical protein GGX14DRAFT_418241 [Mycena pura]